MLTILLKWCLPEWFFVIHFVSIDKFSIFYCTISTDCEVLLTKHAPDNQFCAQCVPCASHSNLMTKWSQEPHYKLTHGSNLIQPWITKPLLPSTHLGNVCCNLNKAYLINFELKRTNLIVLRMNRNCNFKQQQSFQPHTPGKIKQTPKNTRS